MESETIVGLAALIWLVGSFLLMARTIRVGRSLIEALAARHPATYEALGRPRPGYFESVRRTRFAQFIGRREFEKLSDASLSADFDAYRKSEARLIVGILASGAAVVLLAFATGHAV
jgi:hypothetical protein